MEIRIKNTGNTLLKGDPGAADMTDTYRVVDNGREFEITFTSHRHGHNLGIAGQKGILYVDDDENSVRKQVFNVGLGCGVGIESDEPVEGLSPWSIRGVIVARRTEEAREITLVVEGIESGSERVTAFIDGRPADLHQHLQQYTGAKETEIK